MGGEGSAETEENEEGEEVIDEDADEDGEEADHEEVMDEMVDKLVDRVLQASFHGGSDLDTATLGKPALLQIPRQPSHDEVEEDAFVDDNDAEESMLHDEESMLHD